MRTTHSIKGARKHTIKGACFGLFALTTGCGPLPNSLEVTAERDEVSTTNSYKVTENDGAQESTGTVGYGDSCSEAGESTGTRTVVSYDELEHYFYVVGQTRASHPLVPHRTNRFDRIVVDIIAETEQRSASVETNATYNQPNGDPSSWEERSYEDLPITTTASYAGILADEYVVRMELQSLWDDLEEVDDGAVELLTRHNPRSGDVWSSTNGNSLYVYAGSEKIDLGGKSMRADVVNVYETGNVQPNSANVLSDCINVGLQQFETSDGDDSEDYIAHLDDGCEGAFLHVQTGTQWWFSNVLVKEEMTNTTVTINDYGFEWYDDDSEDTCYRETGYTPDGSGAQLYVEYDVTVTETEMEVTDWLQ